MGENVTPAEYRVKVKDEYLSHRDWWMKIRSMSDGQIQEMMNYEAAEFEASLQHVDEFHTDKNSWSYPGEY